MTPPRSLAVGTLLLAIACTLSVGAQNSTRKLRVPPEGLAARAGSAVAWRADLDTALAEAKTSGKPVFWYVPTVQGSPMDRRAELDQYMMAGPFSWLSTVALLNEAFIPVKGAAGGAAQKRYRLTRGEFIEPGWLVLDGTGAELGRLDQITTLHPDWFERPLRRLAAQRPRNLGAPQALGLAWRLFADGAYQETLAHVASTETTGWQDRWLVELRWLEGMTLSRSGRHQQAVALWHGLARDFPEEPLGWKAAMEAQDLGPFSRGFEVYGDLPGAAHRGGTEGSRAPAGTYSEEELWQRGVAYLCGMQREHGGYTESIYDFGGTDSLPNVHVATSAIVGVALLQAQHRGHEVGDALKRLFPFVTDERFLNLADRDEILWAYAYRLHFLDHWLAAHAGDDAAKDLLQGTVEALEELQPGSGAWFHEYPNPFAIATALTALKRAEVRGARVDDAVVDRGVLALTRCRTEQGAFSYGYPRRGAARARVVGAAGRMPLCELALWSWHPEETMRQATDLARSLDAAFEHHDQLASVRKYDDHANRHGYGGFFFWYDMFGRCAAIAALPAGALRGKLAARQRALVLTLPEIDGCFVDSHELGRPYGTGMALWCLALLDEAAGREAGK